MRPTRTTVLLTAGLVTLLGVPAAAAAETPASLYVNNTAGANCTDTGTGAQAAPFCTVSAAAKAVQPGQTVRIKPGKAYAGHVTVSRSGQPGKPISFVADGPNASDQVDLGKEQSLTVSGASHVVLRGLRVTGGVKITGSTDVELDRSYVTGPGPHPVSLVVNGQSADVRVTRSHLSTTAQIESARGTVLSRNELEGYVMPAVAAWDAPGTVVTNNTLSLECESALSLDGASTGSAVFNNLVHLDPDLPCPAPGARTGIVVAQSAAADTRADYNLITGTAVADRVAYKWAGAEFTTQAAFTAATGQGAHDLLRASWAGVGHAHAGSPTIDSGDPTAPGVLPTDQVGAPTSDDPRVANTGKDGGYVDRGARESRDVVSEARVELDQAWAPAGTTVKATASAKSTWGSALTYTFDFGDGTAPVVTKERTAGHAYASPCACVVKVTAANDAGTKAYAETPAKVTAAGPLTADFTSEAVLPDWGDRTTYVAPLTVAVDPRAATKTPWPVQGVDVDFGDGTTESRAGLEAFRHGYAQPGDYKVTVTVRDTKGAASTAVRTVKVAYAASGYVPVQPHRILDTRTTGTPLQGGTARPVTVPVVPQESGPGHSAGATAAVLNVTVTGATEDTHLSVWPAGQPRPVSSNVNVRAGGTSSNTVTVPVGAAGQVLAQLNSGNAALIVDFVGYYQPNSGDRFSPSPQIRLLDTRTTGGALKGGQARTVKIAGNIGVPADATAVAVNLTSTGSTENAHLIAYPYAVSRPSTSNLNPQPGKDLSNQAIVPIGPDGTITLYTNTGSTHVIVDAAGFYSGNGRALFTPAVPQRLADSRTTGKLAPGAVTALTGLPSNAMGAVVNVTATDTTAPGFLSVTGDGYGRPETSSLNTRPGETVPNHVTTSVSQGRFEIWNSYGGSTHVITDLLGYFTY
ncbi:PKD domain-containing protein [Streptomyces sp. NPDC059193]|uniref:PKD domain-containing protein n=1 Tax=Streptomyces sp. NPDC059193 TaxID=3346763 RepID=UPI00367E793B